MIAARRERGSAGARNWGCHAKRQRQLERRKLCAFEVVAAIFWLGVIWFSLTWGV